MSRDRESPAVSHPQLPLALRLREGMDFEAFLPPAGAEVAVARVRSLARGEEPGGQVWLRGAPGSGRTHLLEAAVREAGGGASLLPGEELAQLPADVFEGLEGLSLLALDDVEALAGHRTHEEALFHLYNRCRDSGTALLFAAAAAPGDCGFALPDLASRLAAGPVFRLPELEDAELAGLFRLRARRRGLIVGEREAAWLVRRCERRAAAVVDLLEWLDREALARGRRLTTPFVKELTGW